MVIGNGLIARAFKESLGKNEDVVVFASGVSNSTQVDQAEFEREMNLLKKCIDDNPNKKLIYFSTLSIIDSVVKQRPYVAHKINVETLIRECASNYLIFRVSNVVGSSMNPYTVLNFLFNAVSKEIQIEVWPDTERNLLDIDDLKFLVESILESGVVNKTINLASGKNVTVGQMVKTIELFLGKKANVKTIDKSNSLNIDLTDIDDYLNQIEQKKENGVTYLNYLLNKYYSKKI